MANAAVLSSEYIREARAYTTVDSQGTVNVSFRIYGTNKMDVLGAKTIIVQEQAPGSSQWTAVATYSAENNSPPAKPRPVPRSSVSPGRGQGGSPGGLRLRRDFS